MISIGVPDPLVRKLTNPRYVNPCNSKKAQARAHETAVSEYFLFFTGLPRVCYFGCSKEI